MKKTRVYIGKNLRNLRCKHNLKQKDVALFLGVSVAVYSSYETDKHEPTLSDIIGLSELYNTTVDNILNI